MAKIQFRLTQEEKKKNGGTYWIMVAKKARMDSGMAGSSIPVHHQNSVSFHLSVLLLSFGRHFPCGGRRDNSSSKLLFYQLSNPRGQTFICPD